jgi:uncharacterized protein DUF1360
MSADGRGRWENRATKLTLTGVFLALMGAFAARLSGRGEAPELRPFDLALLDLATFRTGRLIAFERVAAPLREPFTATTPDDAGAGEVVVPQGSGARRVLGELLSCPVCVGTWVAAGLVYGLHLAPRPTRVFLAVMGTTGAAELLNCAAEALGWLGRAARKEAGAPGDEGAPARQPSQPARDRETERPVPR